MLLVLLSSSPKTSELHAGSWLQHRNIEGISPTAAHGGPVRVGIGLLASEQALVHSGLDIDLLTYEQVLVQKEVLISESG